MHKSRSHRIKPHCPACGAVTMRVPRLPEDLGAPGNEFQRRFRCCAVACNWQGLLPLHAERKVEDLADTSTRHEHADAADTPNGAALPPTATATVTRWPRWAPAGALLFVGAVVAGSALLANKTSQADLRADSGRNVPLGESDYGDPLPPTHPLLLRASLRSANAPAGEAADSAEGLTLRQHCAWGRPGGNPYKGTVEQALHAAHLPNEVVQQVAAKVKAGEVTDQLLIDNAGIHGQKHGREFSSRGFAMTYGRTLCVNTKVNFRPGHVEKAALYEVNDATGKRHSVMVPEVCGNVSVLSDRGRRTPAQVLAAGGGVELGSDVDSDGGRLYAMAAAATHSVPEPGTLLGVLIGLAALGWMSRKR
jgi:hypothetical protein